MQEIRWHPRVKIISISQLSYCKPFSSLLAMEDTNLPGANQQCGSSY